MRLQQSSRRTPCPVCGRDSDGDCRWNEEVIFCHRGSSFGPPESLKVGDVINSEGRPWALVRIGSGFDGAAYQFRPHRDHAGRRPQDSGEVPHRKPKPLNRGLADETLEAIKAALEVPEFILSTPSELRQSFALIEHSRVMTQRLLQHLKRIRRDEADKTRRARLQQQIEAVENAAKQVDHQCRDAKHFCRHYLGEQDQ